MNTRARTAFTSRPAFTLVELLVVISVIAVLAAIAIPAAGMIRGKAKVVQCRSNLQQLGTAIIAFRDHGHWSARQQVLPGRLSQLFMSNSQLDGHYPIDQYPANHPGRKAHAMPLADASPKLLLCPSDTNPGHRVSGRGTGGKWGDFEYLLAANPEAVAGFGSGVAAEAHPTSYFYEASEDPGDFTTWCTSHSGYDWSPSTTGPMRTWGEWKIQQKAFGNIDIDPDTGAQRNLPWPAERFPLVRCYHHFPWTAAQHLDDREVLNVAWDGSVFKSSPYWEYDVNPTHYTPPP
ncbi:MAG: type II secretion system protein [Planctomycetota bacterium]